MFDAGLFLSEAKDNKQRLNKKKNFKIDSAASSRGHHGKISLGGLCLRQHCLFLALVLLLTTKFRLELIKTKELAIYGANHKLPKNVYLEKIRWVVQ
jgi:hypothetical protein